jgi:hypothetical protein
MGQVLGARHEAGTGPDTKRTGDRHGENFQALLATVELLAPGGVSADKIRPIWLRQKGRSF